MLVGSCICSRLFSAHVKIIIETKGLGSRKQVDILRNMFSLKLKSVVLFLEISNY